MRGGAAAIAQKMPQTSRGEQQDREKREEIAQRRRQEAQRPPHQRILRNESKFRSSLWLAECSAMNYDISIIIKFMKSIRLYGRMYHIIFCVWHVPNVLRIMQIRCLHNLLVQVVRHIVC